MTAIGIAALLLAAAILVTPLPARQRLRKSDTWHRGPRGRIVLLPALLAATAIAAVAPPALTVVCAAAVAVLARRRRRRERQRRRHREVEAIAAALEVLIGELRVGAHPLRAFAIAASESSGEVGCSLRAVSARAQLGADVPAAIRSVAADSSVPAYWGRLAVFWQLAAEHGLAMSTLMRAAQRDIVDRQRFSERMHATLAGARATAAILAALPGLGVLLGQIVGAHPIRFLMSGALGGGLLMLGVGLVCAGVMWADRIVDRVAA